MLVNYTKPNLYIHYGASQPDHSPTIAFRLLPGVNEIADDLWKEVKVHPTIKKYMAEEWIVEVGGKEGKQGLSGFDVTAALKVVKKTYDKVLLKSWAAADNRPKVQAAITDQLAEIERKTTVKAEEDDN